MKVSLAMFNALMTLDCRGTRCERSGDRWVCQRYSGSPNYGAFNFAGVIADRTIDALVRRGLAVIEDGAVQVTDAGREVVA